MNFNTNHIHFLRHHILSLLPHQLKEMGGSGSGIDVDNKSSDSFKTTEQLPDKKKSLFDFVNKIKPINEEKDHWVSLLDVFPL